MDIFDRPLLRDLIFRYITFKRVYITKGDTTFGFQVSFGADTSNITDGMLKGQFKVVLKCVNGVEDEEGITMLRWIMIDNSKYAIACSKNFITPEGALAFLDLYEQMIFQSDLIIENYNLRSVGGVEQHIHYIYSLRGGWSQRSKDSYDDQSSYASDEERPKYVSTSDEESDSDESETTNKTEPNSEQLT
ncbi:hypothetical protein [Carp edema virus]|nr:hypothetical protein [Carp edema virus]